MTMSKHRLLEPTADEATRIETAIKELLTQLQRANEQMTRDQREIDELKAQTRAILARLMAT